MNLSRHAIAWTLSALTLICLPGCAVPGLSAGDAYTLQRDAEAAYQEGDDQRSEKLFQALLRTTPNDAETWFRLANLYARSDRPDQATEAYQRSLMLNPGDSRAWHNLAIVRLRQAQAALAQAHATAGEDEALRSKTAAMIDLLQQTQATKSKPAEAAKP